MPLLALALAANAAAAAPGSAKEVPAEMARRGAPAAPQRQSTPRDASSSSARTVKVHQRMMERQATGTARISRRQEQERQYRQYTPAVARVA